MTKRAWRILQTELPWEHVQARHCILRRMLLALLLLTQNPVTVRLNHDQFDPGDRARVYVQSAQDGYLVVLHADAEGRIRVLFPLDPTDDDFVRGGRKFEIRSRGDRDAFQIDATD